MSIRMVLFQKFFITDFYHRERCIWLKPQKPVRILNGMTLNIFLMIVIAVRPSTRRSSAAVDLSFTLRLSF